jgi:putative ABC transport system permease protein
MGLLALKAMLADRARLVTTLVGVAFAVVLVNLQGGLYLGLMGKAGMVVACSGADVWVGHRHMDTVDMATLVPVRWLDRVRGLDGVERADPYLLTYSDCAMPSGRRERVLLVGCDAAGLLGNAWAMAEGDADDVRLPDGILVDVTDAAKLDHPRVGDVRELNGRRARVVGLTHGIVGFTTCPYVFATFERARAFSSLRVPAGYCSYFLVKARPGTDVADLVERIRRRVPEADVAERGAYAERCRAYWQGRTGVGLSFGLAACLGLMVGLAIVAQTFYAAVGERIKEFATLRAMGAGDGSVARFLLTQALALAGLGSGVGLVLSLVAARALSTPRAPVQLSGWVMGGSVVLMVVVCAAAAWLPYRRIRAADPALVLRS